MPVFKILTMRTSLASAEELIEAPTEQHAREVADSFMNQFEYKTYDSYYEIIGVKEVKDDPVHSLQCNCFLN